jgi:hypothetical protein
LRLIAWRGLRSRSPLSYPDRSVFQIRDGHGAFREDGNGGVCTDTFQLFRDAGCDVLGGLEVDTADGFRVYLAVQCDPGSLQDLGEELYLPLVVGGEAWGVDGLEHSFGGVVFEEHLAEVAVVGEAVVATGCGDYEAAFGDDRAAEIMRPPSATIWYAADIPFTAW